MTVALVAVSSAARSVGGDPPVTKPVGLAVGHLMVAMASNATAANTVTPPSDSNPWLTAESTINASLRLYYKYADASDVAATSFTFVSPGTTNSEVTIVAFSGNFDTSASPFDGINGVWATANAGDIVIPAISPSATRYAFSMVHKLVNNATHSFTPPGTVSEDFDAVVANVNYGSAGGHETVNSGTTGTRTWDPANTSGNTTAGYFFALKELPISGDIAGTTPKTTASLVGILLGDVAGTTPKVTASLVGAVAGDLAGTTPKVTAALVGILLGDVAGTTPKVTAALDGVILGDLAGTTPKVTAALAGIILGDLAGTTPKVTAALIGNITSRGSVSGGVSVSGNFTGSHRSFGSFAGAVATDGEFHGLNGDSNHADGSVTASGSFSGSRTSSGSTAGAASAAGLFAGSARHSGQVSGSASASGSFSGSRKSSGSFSGAISAGGSVVGRARTRGSFSGSVSVSGTVVGHKRARGSFSGTVAATCTVEGARKSHGVVVAFVTATGTFHGRNHPPYEHRATIVEHGREFSIAERPRSFHIQEA